MSVEAMAWVLHHSPTKGTDKVVLLGIANHADAAGANAWPGIDTLATYARTDRRNVQRSLHRLAEVGAIVVEDQAGGLPETRQDRRPNRYRVVMERGGADAAPQPERDDGGGNDGAAVVTERGGAGATRTIQEPSSEPSEGLSSSGGCAADATIEAQHAAITAIGWGLTPVMIDGGQLGPALELCDLMARQLRDRGIRVPSTTPHSKGWVTPMEALLRLDGHPAENVASVLRWLDNGRDRTSNFWRTVVLSPNKLRLRWDQMREAVRREQMQSARNPALDDGTPLSEILGTTDEATG